MKTINKILADLIIINIKISATCIMLYIAAMRILTIFPYVSFSQEMSFSLLVFFTMLSIFLNQKEKIKKLLEQIS